MAKTAIILGATGATGKELLTLLLKDDRYSTVKLFSRSASGIQNPKIEEHIVNLFELDKHAGVFTADEVYCCIGTTKAQTPNKQTYYDIEYGIPTTAAKLAKANGIPTFIVISAIGSNAKSRVFYVRNKGQMEDAVLQQHIPKTYILQPSLIVAQHRKDSRIAETFFVGLMVLLNPLLFGGMAKYKSIKAADIAKAMIWLANAEYTDVIITSDKIQQIAKESKIGGKP
ncbi:MAG: NAD(P)H-binding protein [Bacteroidota bacterium]